MWFYSPQGGTFVGQGKGMLGSQLGTGTASTAQAQQQQ